MAYKIQVWLNDEFLIDEYKSLNECVVEIDSLPRLSKYRYVHYNIIKDNNHLFIYDRFSKGLTYFIK